MSKRQLIVKVSNFKQAVNEFKDRWKQVEQGEKLDFPAETLHFENTIALMKTLTPKRLELLQQLHALSKTSIRALAKKLEREYSNVHQDIKALHHAGLVLQDKTGKYYMPWDKIITEISMTILTEQQKPHRHHNKDSTNAHRTHR